MLTITSVGDSGTDGMEWLKQSIIDSNYKYVLIKADKIYLISIYAGS